ncbi:hypothetical protein [Streptomyces sp. TLI_171]|uniref:hypothetical protein n=1 Tax=Streptomyces sp. TLI_171 TaxID=1938859 RepID=UPI000C194F84|nr:hypothetical protein [Streptomyces sp. TLI_171]RKE23191.1 hypothetical protein BX266_6649 [Streptomyces sp. TLI_171]
MGVLFGYFVAADDADAARAVVRDDDEPSGAGYDELVAKGLDPFIQLARADELLTGRTAAEVRADGRSGSLVAMVGDGEVVAVSLTDALRDALARCEEAALAVVAAEWAATAEVFDPPADAEHLADFLSELKALAGRAVRRGARLYCWMCL